MESISFSCSICGDVSHKICVYCTKDACHIHLCHRCHRCSECCTCDSPTSEDDDEVVAKEDAVGEEAAELELLTPSLV